MLEFGKDQTLDTRIQPNRVCFPMAKQSKCHMLVFRPHCTVLKVWLAKVKS